MTVSPLQTSSKYKASILQGFSKITGENELSEEIVEWQMLRLVGHTQPTADSWQGEWPRWQVVDP